MTQEIWLAHCKDAGNKVWSRRTLKIARNIEFVEDLAHSLAVPDIDKNEEYAEINENEISPESTMFAMKFFLEGNSIAIYRYVTRDFFSV